MAATDDRTRERHDADRTRRTIVRERVVPARRSRWVGILVALVIIAVIGVVAYMLLYNGDGGSQTTGGGGDSGGLYGFAFAISTSLVARAKELIARR